MEKRVEVKVSSYLNQFKDNVKNKMTELGLIETNCDSKYSELLRFIFDYQSLSWDKDDFTRRRKDGCLYCGTHSKGTPHGEYEGTSNEVCQNKIIELTVQDINGIMYYVDSEDNVYNQSHVLSNKINPECIGKRKNNNGTYSIDFN